MSGDFTRFALAGLVVAGAAAAASLAIGREAANQGATLAAGAILAVGDIAAALWVAGASRRRGNALAWARLGLIAAALTYIALYAIVTPAIAYALTDAGLSWRAAAVLGLAAALGAALLWLSLRLAWRRFAPKATP
ncbi:MAG: hypothetical protein ABL883_06780 [Terricaulis sp.]